MKKILALILIVSGTLNASTYVVSPYTNDIVTSMQGVATAASNGDEIVLPSGSFPCIGTVTITKFISIRGQGLSNTILYRPETASDANVTSWLNIIRYATNSLSSSNIVIQGVCFKSKNPCLSSTLDVNGNDVTALDGLSLASDCAIEMSGCKDFLITKCRFENFGSSAIAVYHDDSIVGGVISKNQFYHNSKGTGALGLGYGVVVYGSNTKWLSNPRFGTSNFIFIEDNYFDYHKHTIAAGGCALYVFRHNAVLNSVAGSSTAAIDMHEARGPGHGSNTFATRAAEIYNDSCVNNTFRNGTGTAGLADNTPYYSTTYTVTNVTTRIQQLTEAGIKPRAGEALIHDNYLRGFRFGLALAATAYCGGSCGSYPIPYQEGYLSGLRLGSSAYGVSGGADQGDCFIWNNTVKLYDSTSSVNKYIYN